MIKRLSSRIFLLLVALLFLQFPLYVTLYMTCLEGHLGESKLQVEQFQAVAGATNKTLDQYIAKFIVQEDLDFHNQGIVMQSAVERYHWLMKATSTLASTTPLFRPIVFLRYADVTIAREVWMHYSVGVILNFDTVFWAVVGIVLGYVGLYFIRSPQSKLV
jgi:hypothetical protein